MIKAEKSSSQPESKAQKPVKLRIVVDGHAHTGSYCQPVEGLLVVRSQAGGVVVTAVLWENPYEEALLVLRRLLKNEQRAL